MRRTKIQRSTRNVFTDIRAAHPERLLARAQVMERIAVILKERGLTQIQAARLLGLSQPKISALVNGKLSQFSLEHLFELINALDRSVEIVIRPKSRGSRTGHTTVSSAA
ncbi:MAG: hypothetical protein MOGMAGMI_00104 [Candidatus Omnitrophica bacterium]|nr:hypothetical protein [Candidatus Omnitrophota bacterium]